MSTKRPDVLCRPPSDLTALTLCEMHQLRWRLRGVCGAPGCGLAVKVSLPTLIRVYGPDKAWWGEHTPCPREECRGEITYWAQSIRSGSWKCMKDPPTEIAVARWKRDRGDYGWKGAR
ncbi:MAG: hypothetical protein DI570_09975 [Phenylobacterium zucineum]|nr:MAG: hypothetical protein DI570_09975 [Phenylobacterium zucineum]